MLIRIDTGKFRTRSRQEHPRFNRILGGDNGVTGHGHGKGSMSAIEIFRQQRTKTVPIELTKTNQGFVRCPVRLNHIDNSLSESILMPLSRTYDFLFLEGQSD